MDSIASGKVVVGTGSGAGIGRDFARAFAAQGTKVVVNDVSRGDAQSNADTVVKEIRAAAPHFNSQDSGSYVHMTSEGWAPATIALPCDPRARIELPP